MPPAAVSCALSQRKHADEKWYCEILVGTTSVARDRCLWGHKSSRFCQDSALLLLVPQSAIRGVRGAQVYSRGRSGPPLRMHASTLSVMQLPVVNMTIYVVRSREIGLVVVQSRRLYAFN